MRVIEFLLSYSLKLISSKNYVSDLGKCRDPNFREWNWEVQSGNLRKWQWFLLFLRLFIRIVAVFLVPLLSFKRATIIYTGTGSIPENVIYFPSFSLLFYRSFPRSHVVPKTVHKQKRGPVSIRKKVHCTLLLISQISVHFFCQLEIFNLIFNGNTQWAVLPQTIYW